MSISTPLHDLANDLRNAGQRVQRSMHAVTRREATDEAADASAGEILRPVIVAQAEMAGRLADIGAGAVTNQ